MPSSTFANSPLFNWIIGYEAKRKKLLKKAPAGALRDFLSVPLPSLNTPIDKVEILAVDFETTGLDAKQDQLLSVGFVTLKQQQISLKTSYHQIIKTKAQLEESNVIIHHITDSQKEQGQALATVVEALLKALATKKNVTWFAPNHITNINWQPSFVELELGAKSSNSAQLTTKLLLACDGVNSPCREFAKIDSSHSAYNQSALITNVSTVLPHKNIAYESGATNKGFYSVMDKVIRTGSRIAITISEKI